MLGTPASKILIVDDDEDTQALVAPLLREAGFTVATASTGWDALKVLESEGVDLIVTAVFLPGGLNGVELVIYARARYPALKALLISGYGDRLPDGWDDDFVTKPFHPWELLGCIYELLSRQLPERQPQGLRREALQAIVEAKIACRAEQRQGVATAAGLKNAPGKAVPETRSILIVDDDPAVLNVATMMIEDLGFSVLRAGDGAEALQILKENSSITLLVTDVVMPGMDGWALGRTAKQCCPDLRVLYMSGFIKNEISLPAEEYGPVLSKPWRSQQFCEAVNRVLVGP
jgi:two-component system cell cycle response regulator CpdR